MLTPSSSTTSVSLLTVAEAGGDDPTPRQKGKRKRTMAGYQVEQTTTGTGTFPPHQQQSEQGTIPHIKLRRVTDNSRSVVGSSTAVQGNLEPMETGPAMAAVVRPIPLLPSPDNPVSSELDNAKIKMGPGVSGIPDLSFQNPVIQPVTVGYLETMEHFYPAHYHALLDGCLVCHLSEHEDIPDLCFSKRVPSADERGVIVDGDHTETGQKRLWHFITAMLIELVQTINLRINGSRSPCPMEKRLYSQNRSLPSLIPVL